VPKCRQIKTWSDYEKLISDRENAKRAHTYLRRGINVRDQTMALRPPITSSLGGTGPDVGQIPLRTYKGEVPISE